MCIMRACISYTIIFFLTEVKLSLMTAHRNCTWIAGSQQTEQVEHPRLSAQMHTMQIGQKQFFSFKVSRKSLRRLCLVVSTYLCYSQGRNTCLSAAKTKHPVYIPKGKHTENFNNDLRHDKQNANAYLIKCATFPYCDQFRVPCLNTKPAYMQVFSPVRRFQKFSEHKSLIKYLHAQVSESEKQLDLIARLQYMFIQISALCFCISNGNSEVRFLPVLTFRRVDRWREKISIPF